jgi:hypothetical protein
VEGAGGALRGEGEAGRRGEGRNEYEDRALSNSKSPQKKDLAAATQAARVQPAHPPPPSHSQTFQKITTKDYKNNKSNHTAASSEGECPKIIMIFWRKMTTTYLCRPSFAQRICCFSAKVVLTVTAVAGINT